MTTTKILETLAAAGQIISGANWDGWDWPQQQGHCECDNDKNGESIILDGPGELINWDTWGDDVLRQLETEGHDEDCAVSAMITGKHYGQKCERAATGALEAAERAVTALIDGNLAQALAEAREASSLEYDYGDDPTWGPLVVLLEAH